MTVAAPERLATLGYSPADDGRTRDRPDQSARVRSGASHPGVTSRERAGQRHRRGRRRQGPVWAFVAPGGAITSQDGTAWFAGWAGDQPAYDPD